MAANLDTNIPLTDEDFAAADAVLRSRGNAAGVEFKARRRNLARAHARIGEHRFHLRYGLREPKNRGEALEAEYFQSRISRDEFNAYLSRPCDEVMLRRLFNEVEDLLGHYGQFMMTIVGIRYRQAGCDDDQADRCIRAMKQTTAMYSVEIETVAEFVAKARVSQKQPIVRLDGESVNTAVGLVLELLAVKVPHAWETCKKVAWDQRQRCDGRMTTRAGLLFDLYCIKTFPKARELQTELRRELTIGLVALDEIQTARARTHSEPIEQGFADGNAQAVLERPTPTRSRVAPSKLTVGDWSQLAIGIDEKWNIWAITPPPAEGAVFEKQKAKRINFRRGNGRKLIEILAASPTGRSADILEVASALDLLPPSNSVEHDRRARRGAIRDEIGASLSSKGSLLRRKLNSVLSQVGRSLRRQIVGPIRPVDAVLSMDDKWVKSGFVVRHLHQDENRHLRLGIKPP